jgi:hypothetical protein
MPRKIEAGPLPAGQLEVNPPFACKGSGACASNGLVERSAKHFTNRDFLAPNVLEIDVDLELLAPLSGVCGLLQRSELPKGRVDIGNGLNLGIKHPDWKSDIAWISQADRAGYDYFAAIFRRLGIADAVADRIEYDHQIMMYSGFYVTRRSCNSPDLHVDWIGGNNDAFTFLTPLSANCGELGLTYRTLRNELAHYDYTLGKGLIFGDHFAHSTAEGQAGENTVLLSFTFGTDRMDNWPNISKSAAKQGTFHRQPDGQFITRTAS